MPLQAMKHAPPAAGGRAMCWPPTSCCRRQPVQRPACWPRHRRPCSGPLWLATRLRSFSEAWGKRWSARSTPSPWVRPGGAVDEQVGWGRCWQTDSSAISVPAGPATRQQRRRRCRPATRSAGDGVCAAAAAMFLLGIASLQAFWSARTPACLTAARCVQGNRRNRCIGFCRVRPHSRRRDSLAWPAVQLQLASCALLLNGEGLPGGPAARLASSAARITAPPPRRAWAAVNHCGTAQVLL